MSGVFLCLLAAMRGILGEQLARSMDHVDPVVEGMRQADDDVLQRALLQASVFVEAVIADMASLPQASA